MNKNKPAIRFKGFSDAWEQRELGELYARSSEKNDGTISIDKNITVATMQFKPDIKVTTKEYLKTYFTFNVGDIAFEGHQSKEFKFGRFVENDIGNGIVSHIFAVFRPITEYDLQFWKYAINNESLMQNILSRSTKASTMMHDLVTNDFLKEKFSVPSLEEQRKIGSFLNELDNLITLHQRKYEKLQNVKKSMLEKMFPKNGSKFPEIRFKGFTDAWEQRKLNEGIIEHKEITTENNQYPPLTSSRKGLFLQTEYFAGNQIASEDNTGYNVVPRGYFTYRHMSDDEIFHFNINEIVENGIVSTLYPVFTTNENLDSKYLQYQLNYGKEFSKFAVLQKQGGSRTYMYLSKLKQLHLTMPKNVVEQKKIARFLVQLDNLITLHQRELEKLQNIKKSMLEKMFV